MTPFNKSFNAAVLHITNRLLPKGYDVVTTTPDNFEHLKARFAFSGRIAVWDGASHRTIFGDREINWAFRAWHDYCHLTSDHDFSLAGEVDVALMQIDQIDQLYGHGRDARAFKMLVAEEVIGQSYHQWRTGQFVADQRQFARSYLMNAGAPFALDLPTD